MTYPEGRALAERALDEDRVNREAGFPPAADHLELTGRGAYRQAPERACEGPG